MSIKIFHDRRTKRREIDIGLIVGLVLVFLWLYHLVYRTDPMDLVQVQSDPAIKTPKTNLRAEAKQPVADIAYTREGYKQMWVYVGNETRDITSPYVSSKQWNSQNGQDHDVLTIFNSKFAGTFIDLAANDAHKYSNTYTMEQIFGWRGICIDANYYVWKSLAHRSCTVVAAAVGKEMNEKIPYKYRNAGDEAAYGGLIKEGMDNGKRTPNEGHVRTTTLNNIFEQFDLPNVVDYLSLVRYKINFRFVSLNITFVFFSLQTGRRRS